MARRRKTLVDIVRDGTFLARQDEQLLSGRDPIGWPVLDEYRRRYRGELDPREAREVALELQRLARQPDGPLLVFGDLDRELRRLGRRGSFAQIEAFAPRYFRHFAGPKAGKPFTFEAFQRDFVREFWRRDRRCRRIYNVGLLGIPKGNGKTPLAAVLATHALVAARDETPEVYVISGAKDQADICHAFVRNNVERGQLNAWLNVGRAISYPARLGEFEILSSDGDLAQGTNPSAAIVDEWWQFLHRKQREGYTALAEALHKRGGESWLLAITTAGWTRDSQLGEVYDAAMDHPLLEIRRDGFLRVLADREAGFLMHWYGAPDDDELSLDDLAIVRAANPASWIDPRDILQTLRRPGADEHAYRRLHLNQWSLSKGAWLPTGAWLRLLDEELEIPDNAEIHVGVDVAHSYDTTAVVWAWRAPDGRLVLRSHVWSVREAAPAHEHVADFYNDRAEHLAELFIHRLAERYRIREVVADPNYFGSELRRLGLHFTTASLFPQSSDMTEYVQEFYRGVDAGAFAHDGDRVLALHLAAIEGKKDRNGYWRIQKLLTANPMDAGTAAIIASGRANRQENPEPWAARW